MPLRPSFPPPRPAAAPRAAGKGVAKPGAGRPSAEGEGTSASSGRGRNPNADVALRLAIGRAGVGLELARSARLGCVTVTELTATLPGARFPVDVSGGVPRFRHRRGVLQTLQVEVGGRALERWAAPRLRGLVGTHAPEVWIRVRAAGASVGVAAVADPADEASRAGPVVAFEVEAIAEQSDLVLIVRGARGTGLPAPATAIAIACVEALLHGLAKREGAMFVIRGGPSGLARALLPEAGARVPASEGVGWTSIGAHSETWLLHAARGALTASPSEEALRSREAAGMLRDGDEALVGGDHVRARDLYLQVLERAPRHGEVARRILEIDARTPGRAEAALATLVEARQMGGELNLGTTPGELLAEVGDLDAAVASLERAGDTEPTPALAARAFEIAACITRDADEAARWLDRAIARAPRSTTARWLRVARRLELGRLEDGLADVEHLDALASGGRAKHAVWMRAGRAWQAAALGAHAGSLFERALRYVPDDPHALAGLGAALVREGRGARGVAVLERALDLVLADSRTKSGQGTSAAILLELARALAERLDDLPAAIARVSFIPAAAPEALMARGLEGRWRARLGDMAGSALAFARLRELATSLTAPAGNAEDPRVPAIVALLVEAAQVQRTRLNDALGAQRHLAAALRLRPHDAELRRAYRDIGAVIARGDGASGASGFDHAAAGAADTTSFAADEEGSAVHPASGTDRAAGVDRTQTEPAVRRLSLDLTLAPEPPSTDDEVRASARAEELTRRLQIDPGDEGASNELALLLELLGRGHELLALLSARLEDATPEQRIVLAPQARAVLGRLAADAQAAGRLEEAALYRAAMDGLPH
jgi:tetratricopeptide (TPR) repeat protein